MSMRYFTLSAVCMLIFCMVLALSGTTDFPESHGGLVSPSGSSSPAQGLCQLGKREAMAAVVPLPAEGEPCADTKGGGDRPLRNERRNRPLLLLGILFGAAWVLLSFRLLSNSKN
jgi:hypothetical protein